MKRNYFEYLGESTDTFSSEKEQLDIKVIDFFTNFKLGLDKIVIVNGRDAREVALANAEKPVATPSGSTTEAPKTVEFPDTNTTPPTTPLPVNKQVKPKQKPKTKKAPVVPEKPTANRKIKDLNQFNRQKGASGSGGYWSDGTTTLGKNIKWNQ